MMPTHTCIAPGCKAPSEVVFVAAEAGRLGGRDWASNDQIRLCWAHADDVYSACGKTHPSEVAEWLRLDAADPPNTWRPWTPQELADISSRARHDAAAFGQWCE